MKYTQTYRMKRGLINGGLFCMLFLGSVAAFGQNSGSPKATIPAVSSNLKLITGKVTDAATRAPLAGVRVQSYGNDRYTAMTGEDGTYTIKVPDYVTSLAIQVEGYNLAQAAINNRSKGVDASLHSEVFTESYQNRTIGKLCAKLFSEMEKFGLN